MMKNYRTVPNVSVEIDPWNTPELIFHGDRYESIINGFIGCELETDGAVLRSRDEEVEEDCYCGRECCSGTRTYSEYEEAELCPEDVAQMLAYSFNDHDEDDKLFNFVSDCSIGGVEIVSNPMTYEFIRDNLEHGFSTFEKYLKAWDINDNNEDRDTMNAGMHVHVSVEAFEDDMHVKRFAQVCEMFYGIIVHNIGQRVSYRTSYCASSDVYPMLDEEEFRDTWYENRAHRRKLQIVNTMKDNTVELRAFTAPRTWVRYLAYIQLTVCLVVISRQKKVTELRWDDVVAQAKNLGFDELVSII
jgi:hypothetical protein